LPALQPLPAALAEQNLLSSVHVAAVAVGVPVFAQLYFGELVQVMAFQGDPVLFAAHVALDWSSTMLAESGPGVLQVSGLLVSVIVYGAQSVVVGLQAQPLHPLPPLTTPCTVDELPRNPAGQVPWAAMAVP
jgi:hypothetical protein